MQLLVIAALHHISFQFPVSFDLRREAKNQNLVRDKKNEREKKITGQFQEHFRET